MARTLKYSEDLLLDAVIQYSDVVKTKIKATELAAWARKNVEGLEDVKDYHFTREIKNPQTGKLEKKTCTQRIEEINYSRDTRQRENTNLLLSSVNIDRFFELDSRTQKKEIQEAKDIVSSYKRVNSNLRRENDQLKSILKEINERIDSFEEIQNEINKKQKQLDKMIIRLKNRIEDEDLRKQLMKEGLSEGDFNLVMYNEALKETETELFGIDDAIKSFRKSINESESYEETNKPNLNDDYLEELMNF